jgi:hypothetical protein
LVVLILGSVSICNYPSFSFSATQTINSLETIISDMKLPHEGKPHGVPEHYGWAKGPGMESGNDPAAFGAIIAWGQVYEDAEGNPAKNTRVQLKDIKAYLLSKKDGKWRFIQSSRDVAGAAYVEDFAGDVNKPADIRKEADGSMSVKAGGGYNFHFWPSTGRVEMDPEDIGGVFTTIQARLIIDDPNMPDDRAKARYLLNMGGDYWLNLNAKWDNWTTNKGIAMGRFKYIKPEWQAFNMTTLTEDELRKNPPPLE